MHASLRLGFVVLVLFLQPGRVAAEELDAASVERHLSQLRSDDPEVRIEGLRALLTSLDPRIPDAMLALLSDKGNSIRRLAARAIGSRWWQIPQERMPEFTAALKRNADSEFEDEQNMVARAVGLLNRDYSGKMFVRSPNKRWVIYERRGLPCLIDTETGTEELLGWSGEERRGWLAPAWGNGLLDESAVWSQTGEAVALTMLLNRKESAAWVWQHRTGLRRLDTEKVVKAVGVRESQLHRAGGIFTEIKDWNRDELRLEVTFTTAQGDSYTDHTAVLAWNPETDKLRVISREQADG